jgi:hypothetical protein
MCLLLEQKVTGRCYKGSEFKLKKEIMKKRKFFTSMITFAVASVFVFASCTNPNKTKQDESNLETNKIAVEIKKDTLRDFSKYTYTERDKFVKDANEELDKINRDIDKLKAELENAGDNISAETRATYEKNIAELEKARDDFKTELDKVQDSSEDAWEKTRQDVGHAYNKTRDGIKKGWEEVKNFVGDGVDKVKEKMD